MPTKPIAIVALHGEHPVTTSMLIAEKFGKLHKDVLKAIRNLECSPDFNRRNFAPVEYTDPKGERRPMYEITRDGFAFLAMGFTGQDAARWKEEFIAAFNAMEKEVMRIYLQKQDADWQQARLQGKGVRRDTTDAIQVFIAYAKNQGSAAADRYYSNYSQMINRQLFKAKASDYGKPFRDLLTNTQLRHVAMAETIIVEAIADGMEANMAYKDIFQLAKDRVDKAVELVGGITPAGIEKAKRPILRLVKP